MIQKNFSLSRSLDLALSEYLLVLKSSGTPATQGTVMEAALLAFLWDLIPRSTALGAYLAQGDARTAAAKKLAGHG